MDSHSAVGGRLDCACVCGCLTFVALLLTDPTVNLVSMTVLGLRLLLVKTVVFNVLMTLRLWVSQCEYTHAHTHNSSHGSLPSALRLFEGVQSGSRCAIFVSCWCPRRKQSEPTVTTNDLSLVTWSPLWKKAQAPVRLPQVRRKSLPVLLRLLLCVLLMALWSLCLAESLPTDSRTTLRRRLVLLSRGCVLSRSPCVVIAPPRLHPVADPFAESILM